MKPLTPEGQQTINQLAQRYGVSVDAVMTLFQAVINGNGTMAQFYHPELGGGGQWMQGGMTMVGDMFNYQLKTTVDNLCNELSQLLARQPFQYQPQESTYASWWPHDLGTPTSSGGQNNIRYAYFAYTRRLAIEKNGQVTVYDTQDHQIGGVSQQQGYDNTLTFSSQYGNVNLSSLPIVSPAPEPFINPPPPPQMDMASPITPPFNPPPFNSPPPPTPESFVNTPPPPMANTTEILGLIERLAQLKEKGILTEQEFQTKKAELLGRL